MSTETFADRCAAAVAAVAHREDCASRDQYHLKVGSTLTKYLRPCTCDRDARIGRKMAAALAVVRCDTSDDNPGACDYCRNAALAAFAEVAR